MSNPDLKPVAERVAPAPTPEEIKSILKADREAREQRAMQRVGQVLAEERCEMNPIVTITVRGVIPQIQFTAKD